MRTKNRVPIRLLHHEPWDMRKMGLKRQGDGVQADLWTLWMTPIPMIRNFVTLCSRTILLDPFGGGTWQKQGDPNVDGYVTSGFRDEIINGNKLSTHLQARAMDAKVTGIVNQLIVGSLALDLFPRIGVYPKKGFMHFDWAVEDWIQKYNKTHYWVIDDRYPPQAFDDWSELLKYCKENYAEDM